MSEGFLFLWKSRTHPGRLHKTWQEGGAWRCTCRAGRKGSCWHLTVMRKLEDCGTHEEIAARHSPQANWI